ncbi:MAG: CBS domain-containing protein [Chloroflexota bacterium]
MMKTCGDVMTADPVCCLGTDTVDKVAQMMRSEDVGPMPVVDNFQTRKLVGIVTDRDLAIKVVADSRDSRMTRVQDVMTRKVATCHPGDDLQKALDTMASNQVRRIPVVDNNDMIVGIISQADIATRQENAAKTGAVVEEISKPA